MFDLGFSELFLIAIVALIVLGPERLPKAARFAGLWIRRARSQWQSVKQDFENEIADEQLRNALKQTREDLRQAREELHQEFSDTDAVARRELIETEAAARGLDKPASASGAATAAHEATDDRGAGSSSDAATPPAGDHGHPGEPGADTVRMNDQPGPDEQR